MVEALLLSAAFVGGGMPATSRPRISRCVVRLDVAAEITTVEGKPVPGAELWYVDTLGGIVEPKSASLLGTSDADGTIRADLCYLGEIFYCAQPPEGLATLRFFVIKDSFGAVRLTQKIEAAELVRKGWAVSSDPCSNPSAYHYKIGEAGIKGYPLPLAIVLRPVKHAP